VLDFGQVYQGPYATLLMAKAGADVIKIEPPQGEPLRRRAPPGKSTTLSDRDAELQQARDHIELEA
jgi:crotonobetainyl-CoA:carnitine CoA-transferase CaiB-like acyl-CoA transferase